MRRGELVERRFEHGLDDGGLRRPWRHDREKAAPRYRSHVARFHLGLILRKWTGFGTPRGWADAAAKAAMARRAFWARDTSRAHHVWRAVTHGFERHPRLLSPDPRALAA